ncbi:MAG: chemotaxis protein CheW [Immundisolibacter sp.]|uniref:chemotaxis protein CheW n=1 Tax=Immundisolibacter sp. TaxID=1934948 RepID=UPI003D11C63F
MAGSVQFCTFYVGDRYLGVELLRVQEVNRLQDVTRVPLAARVVSGLINLRGQIVTAFDLRARLGLPPREDAQRPMSVVMRGEQAIRSFLVDHVGDVVEADPETFEPPPQTLDPAARDFVRAVCKQPGRLLLVIDPERIVEAINAAA